MQEGRGLASSFIGCKVAKDMFQRASSFATNGHDLYSQSNENPEMADFPVRSPRNAIAEERSLLPKRLIAVGLFLVLLALKLFYVMNQPWDSGPNLSIFTCMAWAKRYAPSRMYSITMRALSGVERLFSPCLANGADIVTAMRWAIHPPPVP